MNLYEFTGYYRKMKPGFSHDDYNNYPSDRLINNLKKSLIYSDETKNLSLSYERKYNSYLRNFNRQELEYFYPWHDFDKIVQNSDPVDQVYNQIYVKAADHKILIDYFNSKMIPLIKLTNYLHLKHSNRLEIVDKLANIFNIPTPVYDEAEANIIAYHLKLCHSLFRK